jgi:hypothetical protein
VIRVIPEESEMGRDERKGIGLSTYRYTQLGQNRAFPSRMETGQCCDNSRLYVCKATVNTGESLTVEKETKDDIVPLERSSHRKQLTHGPTERIDCKEENDLEHVV